MLLSTTRETTIQNNFIPVILLRDKDGKKPPLFTVQDCHGVIYNVYTCVLRGFLRVSSESLQLTWVE